ncbi:transmembrane and coiled-coil domains 4 [Drechmeria coniospora]|uniref:Transmembrane and coiled-coil domains 4 n=1 Tax=Drechmeria coniospora TaxID=98403 RepID=A0A151GBZ9_DRECN|nr:transmembrane and coiled-coil domains 4 [Drechmeria coniospora]KYK54646.1 transmembrane and coiled-coil domains 4 [Drechmeria coniospora]ODA76128.1 hypothetical protein RJ55_08411 [Drechmeria coniospora]
MAPLCTDPRQVVIALEPARRQALLQLVSNITAYMKSQLEAAPSELGFVSPDFDHSYKVCQHVAAPERTESPQWQPSAGNSQPERIQRAAVRYMSEWEAELLKKLGEVVQVEDSDEIRAERKARRDRLAKNRLNTPEDGEDLISFGGFQVSKSEDVSSLQKLYHPVPTTLATCPSQDRREALSCLLLLLLSTGRYSAHSRALVLYLASALELPQVFVNQEEAEIARSLIQNTAAKEQQKETMSAEAEAAKRRQQNRASRLWKVGLASVAGATIIGVTGGLAAPLVAGAIGGIMGGVGLGGVASFLGIFWMNGALVGALFGAYGAKMTGKIVDSYAKEVDDFCFIPLDEDDSSPSPEQWQSQRRLRVTIGINGWLNSEEDIKKPWRVLNTDSEVFALRFEMKTLLALGSALQDLVQSFAWVAFKSEIIKRTVLVTLWAALWPIQVLSAASSIDNPFSRARNRSRKAGQLLADALINRVQGERPVTLVGYSLGAAAIHACLQSLAERQAFGLIAEVVLIGTPAPSDAAHWRTLRTVVSGNVFNVYSENDMILGFVYRMHSLKFGVAGLQAIPDVQGVENINLSGSVSGHLRYPELTGEILKRCGFVGVRSGSEIEMDDVIRMKDYHARGKLIDFGGSGNETAKTTTQKPSETVAELHGLNISPQVRSSTFAELNPQFLKRSIETTPEVAAKPVQPANFARTEHATAPLDRTTGSGEYGSDNPPLVKNPDRLWKQRPRQLTPDSDDSYDSDDFEAGEYRGITMVDNSGD